MFERDEIQSHQRNSLSKETEYRKKTQNNILGMKSTTEILKNLNEWVQQKNGGKRRNKMYISRRTRELT